MAGHRLKCAGGGAGLVFLRGTGDLQRPKVLGRRSAKIELSASSLCLPCTKWLAGDEEQASR
jgi:hypothetical protein